MRRFAGSSALIAALLVGSCASSGEDDDPVRAWSYELAPLEGGARIAVRAAFRDGPPLRVLIGAEGAVEFVTDVELRAGSRWHPVARVDGTWPLPIEPGTGCEVRWVFDLAAAARAHRSGRVARRIGSGYLLNPSVLLLFPDGQGGPGTATLHATIDPGWDVACGLPRAADEVGWQFPCRSVRLLPYLACGSFEHRTLAIGGAEVDVVVAPAEGHPDLDRIERWVSGTVQGVAELYGGNFPLPRALVVVERSRWDGLGTARAGGGGGSVHVHASGRLTQQGIEADWVLAHEMVHFGCPKLDTAHRWLSEGLATYFEPIVRRHAGFIDDDDIWADWIQRMPDGQPRDGDRGLDRTPTWGRTYWGGALFCLVADVRIRRATAGRMGLPEAMQAVVADGGNLTARWDIDQLLATADAAIGAPILRTTYDEMGEQPVRVDLDALWRELGVRRQRGAVVVYDEHAPDATIREAITLGATRAHPVD